MKLQTLKLRNFKGCRDFVLDTQSDDVEIFGDNGTGKTTVFDAFTWLLFNKDSLNRSDFEIKMLGEDGEPVHGLSHEVEAVLDVGGKALTLTKCYSESWTKKRGSATKEFTGHSTAYFLDGVPVKKNEYEARIASIVDEDAFKLLTNPRHFNEVLHWQERRKILLDVCGDVADSDVIASDRKLAKLPGILGSHSLEDHRRIIQAKHTEINKELERIPVRIDEAQRGLPEGPEASTAITAELTNLTGRRNEKAQELVRLESGGEVAEQTKKLREIEAQLLQIQKDHWRETADKMQAARVELRNLEDAFGSLDIGMEQNRKQIESNLAEIHSREKKLALLREDWQKVNAEVFTFEQSDTCPTCKQKLPAEQVEEARRRAQADFNLVHAKGLEYITEEGKRLAAIVEAFRKENVAFEEANAAKASRQAELEVQINDAKAVIASLEKQEADYAAVPAYIALGEKKEDIQGQIEALKAGSCFAVEAISREIETIDAQIGDCEKSLAQIQQREASLERIEELKAQERTLAAEYERLEGELFLSEAFVKTKVELLESRVNEVFEFTKWKMFETQVNGGINEVCVATFDGVPYSSGLNNGMRIAIGMDIIRTLQKHYDFQCPVWIDQAESFCHLPEMECQVISLVVSADDPVLRVAKA